MREGDMQLRLKRFEAKQRALKVAVLETMIRDFDRASVELLEQIAAEEERTRIKDTRHVAYSTFATAAALRRRNLLISAAELNPKLAAAKRELDEATLELRDLQLAQSLATQSSGALPLGSPSHVNGVEQR